MAQTETGQQKQRKRMPTQPPGMPMGMHKAKVKAKPGELETENPCRCGGCSFTEHKVVRVKTSV